MSLTITATNSQSTLLRGARPDRNSEPFETLILDLYQSLGPDAGLTTDGTDIARLTDLMHNYMSQESDWRKYAFSDPSKGYTRNLVHNGNGKSNILILVWTPGKGSPIHDHANSHCLMKILKGSLVETLFENPTQHSTTSTKPSPLLVKRETRYSENEVTYMSDELGLHRIMNPTTDFAVSLHLYTPPNAATYGCHIFDEQTSRKHHVFQCAVHSDRGVML